MICPSCLSPLVLSKAQPPVLQCRRCRGQWLSFDKFKERVVHPETYTKLLAQAQAAPPSGKSCPSCRVKMKPLLTTENKSPIDVCFRCKHIWFDFLEFETFRTKWDQLGETFAKQRGSYKTEIAGVTLEGQAVSGWESLTVPVSQESPIQSEARIKGFPVFSYVIMAAMLLAFLKFRNEIPQFWAHYAFHPVQGWGGWKQLFTSFFVHADWTHLLGNMYFMMLLSAEAEDASTTQDFLLVLFGGHVLGVLVQAWATPQGAIAGASAGVFSLLAYYSILFPKARFSGLVGLPRNRYATSQSLIRYSLPLQYYVVVKLALEVILANGHGPGGVAHFAHLGGAAVGVVMGLTRKNKV